MIDDSSSTLLDMNHSNHLKSQVSSKTWHQLSFPLDNKDSHVKVRKILNKFCHQFLVAADLEAQQAVTKG